MGFGAASIGNPHSPVDDDQARATLDAAWAAGVRSYDTAPHYGLGLSERRLGAALAHRPRREFIHDPDDHLDIALGQALPALTALRDQGVIGAVGVGVGMNTVAPLLRVVAGADVDAVMVDAPGPHRPPRWTRAPNAGSRSWPPPRSTPVSSAALAPSTTPPSATAPPPESALRRARLLAEVSARHGIALPHAALRFPLRDPWVDCVVPGFRTPEEAVSAARWAAAELTEDAWSDLDAAAALEPQVLPM
ncbi:aldo/keto reductase [Streptomyces graminifolii]|uniref:aldo/keto reductase n=1 Tax=Streptomyces graminifolii TaxID=1266771 RepID=UPI00405A324C